MGKDTQKGGSQEHSSNTIDLLVTKRMYPMFSTKGKIFFKRPSHAELSDKEAEEIINRLRLKTGAMSPPSSTAGDISQESDLSRAETETSLKGPP